MKESLQGAEEFPQGRKFPALEAELPNLEVNIPAHGANEFRQGLELFPFKVNDLLRGAEYFLRGEKLSRLGKDE